MDYDTYLGEKQKQPKTSMYGSSNPIEILGDTIDGLRAPGMGVADFVMDGVGLMGEWGDELDDRWDAATRWMILYINRFVHSLLLLFLH